MAAAQLNFNEATLDQTSELYDLYSRLYQGMCDANQVDAPDYTVNPPLTPQGEIDQAAIAASLAAYSDILMKNAAYMMANAIISTVSGGSSGGGTAGVGYLSRNGDSMVGNLSALYGFEAGYNNNKIFDVYITSNNKYAKVYGSLVVSEDASIDGHLTLANAGIYFGNAHTIYIDNSNVLNISHDSIKLAGDVIVPNAKTITLGTIEISNGHIKNGQNEYFHQGNLNLSTVDFVMKDGHVYGNLTIDGTTHGGGAVDFLHGFQLGEFGDALLYSVQDDVQNEVAHINLDTDLYIADGKSIKGLNKSIVKVVRGNTPTVSFLAPGAIMNLGGSDGATSTTRIVLLTDIYNSSSDYRMVSANGDGNFPNSFSAGCANAGPTVMQTYYTDATNCGVVFQKKIRLGAASGPALSTNANKDTVYLTLPYVTVTNDTPTTHQIDVSANYIQTTSLFRNLSLSWSATLLLSTDAEFFRFGKPVEVSSISIVSNTYKTRLIENALMFADSVFLEGVVDGVLHNGNSYFTGNLSSVRFASGFAGYGWAINESELYGGIAATFDELTVRKKMRVYELEVQKISVTNGSLWVSDACSGDVVEEIL
jgi:hypothetical protein